MPNKVTTSVKEALTVAFERGGGVTALLAWKKENPTAFFQLWGRMLPVEHAGGITTADVTPSLTPQQRRERLAAILATAAARVSQ